MVKALVTILLPADRVGQSLHRGFRAIASAWSHWCWYHHSSIYPAVPASECDFFMRSTEGGVDQHENVLKGTSNPFLLSIIFYGPFAGCYNFRSVSRLTLFCLTPRLTPHAEPDFKIVLVFLGLASFSSIVSILYVYQDMLPSLAISLIVLVYHSCPPLWQETPEELSLRAQRYLKKEGIYSESQKWPSTTDCRCISCRHEGR